MASRRQALPWTRSAWLGASAAVLLIGLPWFGVVLRGADLAPYLEFPPRTRHVRHADFSWAGFVALSLVVLVTVLPLDIRVWRCRRQTAPRSVEGRWPWWGWFGLGAGLISWALAWTRFAWFAPFQPFTFTPQWVSYIITVNAWTWKRSGRCMLTQTPGRFLALFGLSAAFWWYFEYLNRFVQNWFYVGIASLNPLQYFLFASLPFSTVLPAVLGTSELLATFPRVGAGLDRFVPWRWRHPNIAAAAVLVISSAGLALVGLWPDVLFPTLWLAPLFILVSLQALSGRPTLFSTLTHGDWRSVYRLALAGLMCGLFWELWNVGSQARWVYSIPFVGRFKLFEMPLLGYAGYLPFGLECAAVADVFGLGCDRAPEANKA